jgi:malonyl-CoA/methylmalonyl-CoA synthetase
MTYAAVTDAIFRGDLTLRTDTGETTGRDLATRARLRGGSLSGYAPGSGVLVDVADALLAYEVAAAAWWAGLRVAFARSDSPLDAVAQARAVGAVVHVVDRGRGVDQHSAGIDVLIADVAPWPAPAPASARPAPDDLALDMLTSGSAGQPTCLTYTHAALLRNGVALGRAMGVTTGDRLWTPLPPGLAGVLCSVLLPAALHGATAHLCDADHGTMARSLRAAAPTIVYAVPAVYEVLCRAAQAGAGTPPVRWWLSSSSELQPRVFDGMLARWNAVVRSLYCGSEVGTVTFNDARDPDLVRNTVGRPLPGVTVQVEPGTHRLTVGGDLIAHGERRPDGTVVPFGRSVVTGDCGTLDADGTLRLRGRFDERFNVGTQVVDPFVVEARIRSLPGVADCVVVARPHRLLGNAINALVIRDAAVPLTEADVIGHCRASGLTGGWVPRRVSWVDEIPRTPAGKPRRSPVPTGAGAAVTGPAAAGPRAGGNG